MTPPQQIKKDERRKRITRNNALFGTCAYGIGGATTLVARALGVTSMSYADIVAYFSLFIVISLAHLVFIATRKQVSRRLGILLFVTYYSSWFVAFWFWVLLLDEGRYLAPYAALTALIFLLAESTFLISLGVSTVIIVSYLTAAWVGTAFFGQQATMTREIMITIAFIPATVFVSYMAQVFKNQRREVQEAKRAIERARDELWGEMELAKKIQSVLLPGNPAIEGYQVATYLSPAAEVGGDYYDVINIEGMDWLVIGDVSGHGVTAGLVMMMVQTAIHTVLVGNPRMAPHELLVQVNRVITDNIARLNEDKYMTITVLACLRDGVFHYSGLHQDIMLYRANTGQVERIETDGIWLGIMRDIGDMNPGRHFTVEVGDAVLLYTDGITEAWVRGSTVGLREPGRDMFGDERLATALLRHGAADPETIKRGILAAMDDFVPADDVTLVILKRLR